LQGGRVYPARVSGTPSLCSAHIGTELSVVKLICSAHIGEEPPNSLPPEDLLMWIELTICC
jgi:hypothetical protein